jgi:O-methyltransferase
VKKNEHLKGDIVEVGVWRGGTGALLAKAAESYSNCKVYLADTFTGVVKASSQDTTYKGGEHADTSIEMVEKLLADLHVNNTVLLQGIFPNEVHLNNAQPAIRLCHIDVDTYASAKDIFDYIWPYIVPGGCVVFDDYGFWGCEGVTKLCNEISLSDATFIHNINGHGIFIKV